MQQGHAAAGSSNWQREDEGERGKQRGNVRRRKEAQNIGQNQLNGPSAYLRMSSAEAPLLPSQPGATLSPTPPAPEESPRSIRLEQGSTSADGDATTMPGAGAATAAKTVAWRAPAATVVADPAELDTRTRSAGGGR